MPKISTIAPLSEENINSQVGARLRTRRQLMGLTQEKLAEQLGVTFQQVQKYENGSNRISASRLFELAGLLNVPLSYFFEDSTTLAAVAEETTALDADIMSRKETVDLVRAYYALSSPEARRKVLEMIKALGTGS